MRVMKTFALLAAIALCATAQVSPQNAESVQSIFNSGLAGSLLNADTVPASITTLVSGSDFGSLATFAAGSWIEIKGNGLADTTRQWAGSDFSGSAAPTVIDNVRVTVGSQPAFVYYVSPTQVNVQVPNIPSVSTGPVEIRLTNPTGGIATQTGQLRPTAPGMLAPASFNVGGRQYLVAQFSDQVYVGRNGLIQGAAFRPANPGDNITAYGIGFGPTNPAVAPGTIVPGSPLTDLPGFSLSFGSTPATVSFKGLAPGYVGLYQFNIVVPNVPAGDQQINITFGGQPLQQPPMYLTIGAATGPSR